MSDEEGSLSREVGNHLAAGDVRALRI